LISIPIAVGLNIFRIGMTGLLVDAYGVEVAEGFFHGFSGWLLFVTGLALLGGVAWVLGRIGAGGRRRSLLDLFGSRPQHARSEPIASGHPSKAWWSSPAYLASVAALIPVLVVSTQLASREEVPPPRLAFTDFPMDVGGWKGRNAVMDQVYLDALRFDDYVLADYRLSSESPINLYVAYYRSQKKGQSAHSPRTCMPGGGWEIASLRRMEVPGAATVDAPLEVNRTVIKKGDAQQVVWYWFQERGRIVTNEYLVKLYLLWDAITKNRTDGALVRLTAVVQPGESDAQVDGRLAAFVTTMRPILSRYIPN
jgi:exosortase D (VPLPA-CTERM-specific)